MRCSEGGGQDFYYRVPGAELAPAASGAGDDSNKTRQTIMIAGIVVGRAALLLGLAIFLVSKKRKSECSRERSQEDYLLNAPTIPSKRDQSGDQTEANTKKVVGTYGYMSPEYAMDGLFSIKSDVFSFGVLVLERVSGTKNRGFYQTNNHLNLLAYVSVEIIQRREGDSAAGEEYVAGEVLRCIQVGLLCVQEQAEDRPNMSNVVLLLSSDFVSMQQPTHPGYCLGRRPTETRMDDESCTVNQVTVTMLDGRISFAKISHFTTLLDNNTSLVSPNSNFVLGFFSPRNSTKVAIQTVVWVANKNQPISDSSGALSTTPAGNIVITSNQSSPANSTSSNPVLRLLDNGNLVLDHEGSSGSYSRQSFDYPCDTLIPGMRLGWDLRSNQELYLTSWKSMDNPSPGEYTSCPWDGVRSGGTPALHGNSVFIPIFVFNSTYVYYSFENTDGSVVSRLVVGESGALTHFRWSEASNDWISITTLISDTCDEYDKCGSFGVCEFGRAALCDCLAGFVPRVGEECSRRTPLNCSTGSGEANGCVVWSGEELLDIRVYEEGGQELFVKMRLSELVTAAAFVVVLVPEMAEQHDFPNQNENARISDEDVALPMIDFLTISTATNEFSFSNKIGEGGFGPVYKNEVSKLATSHRVSFSSLVRIEVQISEFCLEHGHHRKVNEQASLVVWFPHGYITSYLDLGAKLISSKLFLDEHPLLLTREYIICAAIRLRKWKYMLPNVGWNTSGGILLCGPPY
ncbi:hypothetical protein SASPL_123960 [Salvia splendens]|uniref:Bulb-type lectin domain-containing protein n=1 Tax=Salvia splendens TaxID=180675 RepID=A0A8X8XML9_SALSN|nr:hypothetical protein SASPL_123960 [Salvia splendens]